jgi:aminoglycoside 6'-N-acetyltransferase I
MVYVLVEDEQPIGFIELSIRRDYVEGADEPPVAYVEGIYVQEGFRNKGGARELIHAAESWAKSKGLRQLCSDTELANQASIDFHKASGFEEAGRLVCFVKAVK